MKKKEFVFSIVVTYNSMNWIHKCLTSIYETTNVIVVDNNSSDTTVEYIKSNFPEVTILNQNENLGFGKANNIGIKYALFNKAEFVLLLNQDARIFNDAIDKMVQFLSRDSRYGIVSPIHCDWSGDFLESSFASYINYEENENFYSDFVLQKEKKEVYDVSFIAAACWFMPKKVLEEVGGFDPIFFHIGEDSNLAQRILFHNYKIGVLPNCKVGHDTKNRSFSKIIKYSDSYFYKINYHRKIKFANVNIYNTVFKVKYLRNQLYKEFLFELIQFRISNARGIYREINDLKSLLKESLESIKINRNKGQHYI